MAAQMLAVGRRGAGPVQGRRTSRPSAAAAARSRCSGGRAPTLLNPHFAVGTKDQDGSRIFYEPLASWDPDGNLSPDARRRDPDARRTAGVAKDGKSVTWKLKKGVTWHDGKPFTADDCVFTWEYVRRSRPRRRATIGTYKDIKVEKVDSHTIKVTFKQADAVLGRRLLRRARHDHPQAPVRGLQGRQVARGARPT